MIEFSGKYRAQYKHLYKKYEFRYNVVIDLYEYRFKRRRKNNDWMKYNDRVKNNLLLELSNMDLETPSEKLNSFIESETISYEYNPFEEYFETLPKWKKKKDKDYIGMIAKTIKTENPDIFRDTLERFLVGTLDCLLNVDAVNDVCLVFQSGQGVGKTRWMRKLLPKEFRSQYLFEGAIDTKNKDHTIYLSQYWFMHLDELESLKNNDISALKSYITRQRISVRKAYGRYKSDFVRRASFLGSVNEDAFLSDTTGNRRWLVFRVLGIDYEHKINADMVWAQAYALLKNKKYRYWFNIDEIKALNKRNEEFRHIELEEELLIQNFEFNDESGRGEWLSSSEIISKILSVTPHFSSKLYNNKMGRICTKHTQKVKRAGGYKRYWANFIGKDDGMEGGDFSVSNDKLPSAQVSAIDEDDDLPF